MLPHTKFSNLISDVVQTPDCRAMRLSMFSAITIHHTANVGKDQAHWAKIADGVKSWLTTKDANYVSAHFQINRDGKIIQLCDPRKYEAFHAGVSQAWHSKERAIVKDWNKWSVGIELVGDGNVTSYTNEQYRSLILLLNELMKEFNISYKDIKGHDEIAWPRKNDPGSLFRWDFVIEELVKLNI